MPKNQRIRKLFLSNTRNKRQKYPIYENTMILYYRSQIETFYIYLKQYVRKHRQYLIEKSDKIVQLSSRDDKTRPI